MSDLLNISDFSYSRGLNLAKDSQSFTYLYGLSDFWQYLFQDTSVTNLLLETTSVQASDIYNNFLQLCTGLSIADIGPSASSQLRLEILSTVLTLPANIRMLGGTWNGSFTTIQVDNLNGFYVGDTITVSGVVNTIVYDVGNGINVQPISQGGDSYSINASGWNGTFIITSTALGGYITYYQPSDPGPYTYGGMVSTTNIGVETYQLSEDVNTTRFIANRAFLPTIVLEENVDYVVNADTLRVSFAQPLASYGFPTRLDPNNNLEYSVWFVDATYDEDLIYSQYPLLLGLTKPKISNEAYRNFLYGLYYVYTSGPTLTVIEKGINLVLGIPLARADETVLEVRPYPNTSQFLVITDQNSYIIPPGLPPTVTAGDTLLVGDELSKWVEILDYETSGPWWLTYSVDIPPELMPTVPAGFSRTVGSPATFPGYDVGDGIDENAINDGGDSFPYTIDSYGDFIMQNYLRYNTFLVKVNVPYPTFLAAQQFDTVPGLLLELKPTYTYPIYTYNVGYTMPISGNTISTSVGNVSTVSSSTQSITGVSGTFVAGSVTRGANITGVASTSAVGNVASAPNLTGVSAAGSVASVVIGASLSGVSATTSVTSIGVDIELEIIEVDTLAIPGQPLAQYAGYFLDGSWYLDGTITLGSEIEPGATAGITGNSGSSSPGTVTP